MAQSSSITPQPPPPSSQPSSSGSRILVEPPTSSSSLPPTTTDNIINDDNNKWDKERLVRTISNTIIVTGVVACLGLAVAAVSEVDSESTVIFLLLVPSFFGGGCLLTLVNVSWMSRRPGNRCSLVQVICNMVLILMTMYVELLFWSYRRDLALAILCGAALPMFIFINMPSVFMLTGVEGGMDGDDMNTVMMQDDEHSLFDCCVVEEIQATVATTNSDDNSSSMNINNNLSEALQTTTTTTAEERIESV